MVGRDQVVATAVAAVATEDLGLVAVCGPPGIGKTRFLVEVADRFAAERADRRPLALRGHAAEFEQDLPFGVWVDAIDEHLRRMPADELDALLADGVEDELALVLPAVAERTPGAERRAIVDERHRMHAAVRLLLERLAARRPLLVVLDDLHWADEGSIDLVSSLLRRPPVGDIALVLALRPAQASSRLAAALERAERDGGLLRITLEVLDDAACDALIGDGVPADRRRAIRTESGGNPFYLQQLARTAGTTRAVPAGVVEAIAEELRSLSPTVRRVLEGVAVVGDPFDPVLVGAAAEASAAETSEALDELVRRELVRVGEESHGFSMRHPLVRRGVYEASGAGWRLRAHGRVVTALRARGAGPALLAHHVARSAEPGDREAAELLRAGATAVAERSPASAADWLSSALQLLEGGAPDPEERLAVLQPLTAALTASGQLSDALAVAQEAVAAAPREPAERRGALVAACAALEHRIGHHEVAQRRLQTALDELPDGQPTARLSLLIELVADGFYRQDLDAMAAWATEALALAEREGDAAHAFAATAGLALAAVLTLRVPDAQRHWRDASAALGALTDEELARRLDGMHFLAIAGMYLERFAEMNEQMERGIRVARATRQGSLLPVLTLSQGFGLAMLGRLEESIALLDEAVEAERVAGSPFSLGWVLMNEALALLFAGAHERSIATMEEGLELFRAVDVNITTGQSGTMLADALFATGNVERAAEELLRAAAGPEVTTVAGFWRCYCFDQLVQVGIALGRMEDAEAAAARSERHAEQLGLPLAQGWALRSRAFMLLATGAPEAAAEAALAGAALMLEQATPIEEARTRTLAGRAFATAGRRAEAIGQLEAAVAICERCGADGYRDLAARELRKLGRRPVRGTLGAAGLESLSGREREVADLVADGCTNGEVAAALYLSPKTVETHLRNVFAKLRVSSRLEVARMIDRDRQGREATSA